MKRAVKAVFVACVVLGLVMGLASAQSQNKPKVAVYVTGGASTPPPAPVFNIDMVFVSGGIFTMGCTSEQGSDCYGNERPSHSVTLSSFSIGKYPVTQAQWVAVMGSNPSYFTGDLSRPVERVSWNDIVNDFIPKLNALTGKTYRLPTESEWEFVARGGTSSMGYKYSGSNSIGDVAWYDSNSDDRTTRPVGTKQSNELGLFDMSGNVWEWVGDWFGSYTSTSKTNPTGSASGSNRVIRGGGWISDARNCRVSFRNHTTPDDRGSNIGFRLVLSP
jgi:formylglycine-generating enzyme required for sulfatase activity